MSTYQTMLRRKTGSANIRSKSQTSYKYNNKRIKPKFVDVLTIEGLLRNYKLEIPEYQRPYKWQEEHIASLLDDLQKNLELPSYRLGTMVLFKEKQNFFIVDGQQRFISIILILLAYRNRNSDKCPNYFKDSQISKKVNFISNSFNFISDISKANIQQNYRLIEQELKKPEFQNNIIEFLLKKCEVVVVTLDDISEAFQFFDAQNARGKDLDPHDLLKAFHLREFSERDKDEISGIVTYWESLSAKSLKSFFAYYLYPTRGWIQSKSSRNFTKSEIGMFKGINLDKDNIYPFAEQYIILNLRSGGQFPFQLDQRIINGKRFFEMVEHYRKLFDNLDLKTFDRNSEIDNNAQIILKTIHNYTFNNSNIRIGDIYILRAFKCLLVFYIDKFNDKELSNAIRKIFIWIYSLRLNHEKVQLASVDNYILEDNLFQRLSEAHQPKEFLAFRVPIVQEEKSSKTGEISKLFKELGYMKDA